MINEVLFLIHVFLVLSFSFAALKLGKKALIAMIAIQAFLANFFVLKQIDLFGLTVTATDVFTIGSIFSFNLLQEYFGKEIAKKAMAISFFVLLFVTLMSQLHLNYAASSLDSTQIHYQNLLSLMPRLAICSFSVFFFSQYVDMKLFSYLKETFTSFSFGLRSFISMSVSQFIDTVLFTFLALNGLASYPWHIILISYVIKLTIISLNSVFSKLSKRFIPKEAL